MEALSLVLLVVFAVSIYIFQRISHQRKIMEQIKSIGGDVINIERKSYFGGPFIMVGKGHTVYRIEYRKGSELKEGWVRFGSLLGPDWRL
jgi:hypothetical protein